MFPALEAAPTSGGLWGRATALGPRVLDIGLLGLVLAAGLVDVLLAESTGLPHEQISLLSTAVIAVLVLARRWAPVPVFGIVAGCTIAYVVIRLAPSAFGVPERWGVRGRSDVLPFTAPIVALGGMAISLVRTAPARIAGAVAVVLVGASGLLLTFPMYWLARAVFGAGFVTICGVGIGSGLYLRDLDRRGAAAATLARRDERLDIARELHDLVAHYVTGIVVQAQAARVVADRDPAAAANALDRIEVAGKDALASIRTLVGSLRDDDLAAGTAPPIGLAGLGDLAATSDTLGIAVELAIEDGLDADIAGVVAAAVHRIAQEALSNVRRHAEDPKVVRVEVTRSGPNELRLVVQDDGRHAAASSASRPGYGVIGMRERAVALGGSLEAGPVAPPGRGWRIVAVLPLEPRA